MPKAEEYPGGLATSFTDDHGFTYDIGGHVMFSRYSYYDDLVEGALQAQDDLYTVVTRSPPGDHARVIAVMPRYLFAPDDGPAVMNALVDERTRLVTLTITAAFPAR